MIAAGYASLVGALACPAVAALLWSRLSRLTEPIDDDQSGDLVPGQSPAWVKPTYADVASRRDWLVATLLVAAALGAWAGTADDPWPWFAWASAGLVLVVVDLATTYLPVRLHWWAAALTLVGVAAALVRQPSWALLGSTVGGAAVAAGFFWLVWRFSGQFGFGDVRLAAPLGALAGLLGWPGWFAALLAGTALGAVHGLVVTAWRRRHPSGLGTAFPYGPALWCGPWVALLVSQLSR
ncbi:prepilin peptidase [Aestuariimicrobium soli]|uniref:prepilin peptidase n=1 Tax=Aestuariimicrobium soli TaxID=2035834 RepID=UPI003EBD5674